MAWFQTCAGPGRMPRLVSTRGATALHARAALEADQELVEIGIGRPSVIADAVDELERGGAIAVGLPGEVRLLCLALRDQGLGSDAIDVRAIDRLRGLVIPGVGLCL